MRGSHVVHPRTPPFMIHFAKNVSAIWLPSENEWYKAAHYDPSKGGTGGLLAACHAKQHRHHQNVANHNLSAGLCLSPALCGGGAKFAGPWRLDAEESNRRKPQPPEDGTTLWFKSCVVMNPG